MKIIIMLIILDKGISLFVFVVILIFLFPRLGINYTCIINTILLINQ